VIYFVDFEASSLTDGSFPVEIGWVSEDGLAESHLIRPEPSWTAWSWESQQVHGVSREQLHLEGRPAEWVARRVFEVLDPAKALCISDAVEHDQHWLELLMQTVATGSRLMLMDVNMLLGQEVRPLVGHLQSLGLSEEDANHEAVRLVLEVEEEERRRTRMQHRALEDAMGLRWRWAEVRNRAKDAMELDAFDWTLKQLRRDGLPRLDLEEE
jgi:hypothetical protein